MLARWYLLFGQFWVTFEYRPGAQHANADGMSRQCGQCQRPDCPVSSSDSQVAKLNASSVLLDQPFASLEMGDSMDADLLPELSGETWVASALLEGLAADLPTAGSDIDLIVASRQDATLTTVWEWVQSGVVVLDLFYYMHPQLMQWDKRSPEDTYPTVYGGDLSPAQFLE